MVEHYKIVSRDAWLEARKELLINGRLGDATRIWEEA